VPILLQKSRFFIYVNSSFQRYLLTISWILDTNCSILFCSKCSTLPKNIEAIFNEFSYTRRYSRYERCRHRVWHTQNWYLKGWLIYLKQADILILHLDDELKFINSSISPIRNTIYGKFIGYWHGIIQYYMYKSVKPVTTYFPLD